MLARLPRDAGLAVVRDGPRTVIGIAPSSVRFASGADALAQLESLEREGGFWAGFVSYDLGRTIERVRPSSVDDLHLPDLAFARFDTRLVLDPSGPTELVGDGPGRELLERALWRARARDPEPVALPGLGGWSTSLDEEAWTRGVEEILELLRAGECYQVNLTRRLTVDRAADPVDLFIALARHNPAPHAGLVALGDASDPSRGSTLDVAVVSASPERFLSLDGRHVETRPVKGTGSDAARLAASAKDHAENVIIVDLARNDLGRVCEYGSVQVPRLFDIEEHPGLFHLVSTVTGRLRPDVGISDLLRATFPPASVTGAPKPRVLQVIEDLEPVPRGAYCGAIGWVDTEARRADLAVAIRTFAVHAGGTDFGVGAGITADSNPADEWAETELKAARLLALAGRDARVPAGAR